MRLYMGTHEPAWLGRTVTPLMVSCRRLERRRSLPRALGEWVMDSGAFTELRLYGGYRRTERQYLAEVNRCAQEIGNLQWAAPLDWMCEPEIIAKTGLTVEDHLRRTVRNFVWLREHQGATPIIPVVQGASLDDYRHCITLYQAAGVDLFNEPLVGLGSVCRRKGTRVLQDLLADLPMLRWHVFGSHMTALGLVADRVTSADSMAWSAGARRSPPLAGHSHRHCNNCMEYAEQWYQKRTALEASR